ncbi:MAG TPA: alpha/beta hydrolase [Gammaproteobacteria bacterium]|nr:alpha/beta hydrolase [Gammaproteobacteria bacterium]
MTPTIKQLAMLSGLLLATAVCGAAAAPASAAPSIQFHTCVIKGANGVQSRKARCGTLSVPENRAAPDGKRIELAVAVLPAVAANPAPDPLFFIAGGPGQSAVDGFFSEPGAFAAVHQHRDIVLVDQRGTGKSHSLNCPAPAQQDAQLIEPSAAERKALVEACLKQLTGDPRYYTTSVAIADLDAVRQALGAKQVNLYGISYGTRVALEYLRYYGDHVRSVVLDGVVPADLALGPQVSVNAERALENIFERCQQAEACAKHFPDLAHDFRQLNDQLREQPAKLTVPDPVTGESRQLTLTQPAFANGVRLLTYMSETSSLLPLLIHKGATGYLGPLAALVSMINTDLAQSLSQGMYLSVLCTEDVPFYGPDAFTSAAARHTWAGTETLGALHAACSIWPRGEIRPDFKKPVKSAKPVLLLSGANDPITPPKNAAHAAKTLSNSLSIVVPGQGHGNAFRGCLPRVMASFIQAASVKHLDTECIKRIRPAPFFLRFTGPAP